MKVNRFREVGESNARVAIDQADTYGKGDSRYDRAHDSYLQNVCDTVMEMGARPGSRAFESAIDAYSEKFSELYANRKKLKSMRRKHRRATKRRILGR